MFDNGKQCVRRVKRVLTFISGIRSKLSIHPVAVPCNLSDAGEQSGNDSERLIESTYIDALLALDFPQQIHPGWGKVESGNQLDANADSMLRPCIEGRHDSNKPYEIAQARVESMSRYRSDCYLANIQADLPAARIHRAVRPVRDNAPDTSTQENFVSVSNPPYSADNLQRQFDEVNRLESARLRDKAARRLASEQGKYKQLAASLGSLNAILDQNLENGISASLTRLSDSFSEWRNVPNSKGACQLVFESAGQFCASFHHVNEKLNQLSADIDQSLKFTVTEINTHSSRLCGINKRIAGQRNHDPSLESELNVELDELASLISIHWLFNTDGTATVLAGRQTVLAVGGNVFSISIADPRPEDDSASTTLPVVICNCDGLDVTAEFNGGKLGSLLQVRNEILPTLQGDNEQPGMIDQLARAIADRANDILCAGLTSIGTPAGSATKLLQYNGCDPSHVAASLVIDPGMTPEYLAAVSTWDKESFNERVIRLAGLGKSKDEAGLLNGLNYFDLIAHTAADINLAYNDACELFMKTLTSD